MPDNLGPIAYYNQSKNSWTLPRDYLFFGMMAGVRRDHIAPIKEPRGIPTDVSAGVKKEREQWAGDGHTSSYYTLQELLDARDKTVITVGFVDLEQFKLIKIRGYPDNWTNEWYSDPILEAVMVPIEEMERIFKLMVFWDGTNYYTEAIWEHPYMEVCPYFWKIFVPAMQKLDPNPENVRFVFWFDN